MTQKFNSFALIIAILLAPFYVHAEEKNTQNSLTHIHTRTLAASCAACHGSNGNSVATTPVLAGLDKRHFKTQMLAFRSGERLSTVMHRHAKGLTPDEIDQLADYFSAQKRINYQPLVSQQLKGDHE